MSFPLLQVLLEPGLFTPQCEWTILSNLTGLPRDCELYVSCIMGLDGGSLLLSVWFISGILTSLLDQKILIIKFVSRPFL